jgi:predicted ATPase
MLTRLHVQGFKNLLDVDMRFGPFTCVVGENGVGKSNLFDAIRFLRLLSELPVPEAVSHLRATSGQAVRSASLFTAFGNFRAPEMRFVAEMVVPRTVEDDLGAVATACISTVRYEIAFRPDSEHPGSLALIHESLTPITQQKAKATLGFPTSDAFRKSAISGKRAGTAFMSTREDEGVVSVHQEGNAGRNRQLLLAKSRRAVIQSANAEFPTLLAARREMESWQSLMLEPSAMRAPSAYTGPRNVDERGGNLPGTLRRLADQQGEVVWQAIANRLAELIPDVRELRVADDPRTETLTLEVRGPDGVFHPARALSDGTLRFLVLATLAADPEATGTLCIEEPENGIHPERVTAMVRLLRDLAVDSTSPLNETNPLRQVVINSHSPLVYREVPCEDRLFMTAVDAKRNGSVGRVAKVEVPANTWRAKGTTPAHPTVAPGKMEMWQQMRFDFDDAAQ